MEASKARYTSKTADLRKQGEEKSAGSGKYGFSDLVKSGDQKDRPQPLRKIVSKKIGAQGCSDGRTRRQ